MSRWLDIIRLRLRTILHRQRIDDELERELHDHIDRQVEELIARGLSHEEARRETRRMFGGFDAVTESARDARGVSLIDNVSRDLRYTLRGLLHEPMLLLAATISITLGAGGNIAVLSLANELLLTRPDVRRPEELVRMRVSHGSHASYQRWLDLDASGALAGIAGYSIERQLNWVNGDAAIAITPMLVTANFFEVTGVPLAMGRPFSSVEAQAERNPRVAIVSHSFWQRELGADSGVLGRGLILNGEPYTIVGVLPSRLRSITSLALAPSVYVPVNRSILPEMLKSDARVVELVGRLKQGQTLAQGRSQVNAADRRLGRLQGDTVYAGVQDFAPVGAMSGKMMRTVGAFFVLLGLVSLLVLLIACANVAGLLIARSTTRRREIAIRLALGGTRARIVQQFLIEGFWLALLGTTGGVLLSVAFMRLVNGIVLPVPIPFEVHLAPDGTVFAGALGLVLLCMILCSLFPALTATRLVLTPALKREEPQYRTRHVTPRGVLLAGQVTVSTVLLVTAFLFIRNLARAQLTSPGFEVDRALVAEVGFLQGRPADESVRLLEAAAERVRAVPGVASVSYSSAVPLTMHGGSTHGTSARIDNSPGIRHVQFAYSLAGPGYFATLRVRLLQGREFGIADDRGSPNVAVVNEEFVRQYFDGRSPIGSRIQLLSESRPADLTVVGVVANGKHVTLGEEQRAAIYQPLLQNPEGLSLAFVLARTEVEPGALIPPVRKAIGELDRSVAVEVESMRSALAFALLPSRFGAAVLGAMGTLGLVLAMFGLYAIVSYTVSRRVSEIAIRVALGATERGILRLVVRDATVMVGIGLGLGLAIASLATRPFAAFLVAGLSATDPLSFTGTAAAFVLVGALAAWVPARRALRVSPVIAMRLD